MKSIQYTLLLLVGLIGFSSCEKDQGPSTQEDFGQEMVGTYIGSYSSPLTPQEEQYEITITRNSIDEIRVLVPDFGAFDVELELSGNSSNQLINTEPSTDFMTFEYLRSSKNIKFNRRVKTLGGETKFLIFDGFRQ